MKHYSKNASCEEGSEGNWEVKMVFYFVPKYLCVEGIPVIFVFLQNFVKFLFCFTLFKIQTKVCCVGQGENSQ